MDIHTQVRNYSIFNEVDEYMGNVNGDLRKVDEEELRKMRDRSIEALGRDPQDDLLFKGMDGKDYFYSEDRKMADEEYQRRMYVPIGEHYLR
ncbi:hypothetical protein HY495_03785 [Candidatus Woesearchaeota archaeon]|nr:hypothetical protein [Candidatus Woesearchaeota archaeon]